LQNFALQPVEISKRYHSVLVKYNCALFAPTPLFSSPGYPTVSLKGLDQYRDVTPGQTDDG